MDALEKSADSISHDASQCKVFDSEGNGLCFGELLDQQGPRTQKVLIVFIRHFFCGNCQEYVRRLATDCAPDQLPSNLSILIIGCGAASLISSYMQLTGCPFPIYADPSTNLYKVLGMQRSLSLGRKGPAYIRHSLASGMVKSIVQGLKRIPTGDVMQAGHLDVNGGEFLLERIDPDSDGTDAEWDISWSHCMHNSRDHTEIEVLKEVLQLKDSSPSAIDESKTAKRRTWMMKAGSLRSSEAMGRTTLQVT